MGLSLYTWLFRLALPLILMRLIWRGFRNPDYWRRWPERFGFVDEIKAGDTIWIHAVSVGEVRAAIPLIRKLLGDFPQHSIHVTTMTPTGSAQVKQAFPDEVGHSYVPYDYRRSIRRFIKRVKPVMLVAMETELWPNILHACHQSGIAVLLANARMSQKSMLSYEKYPRLTRQTLDCINMVAAQTSDDARRLAQLGLDQDRIQVCGSIKFDIEIPEQLWQTGKTLRQQWGEQRKVWIAASTHDDEEQQLLPVYKKLKSDFPDLLFVVVPRHPERFERVWKLCRQSGFSVARRSSNDAITNDTDILLGDTMGELVQFYIAADVAFIGGTLVPHGGQNPIESLATGTPVLFGPSTFNFSDIMEKICTSRAGDKVEDTEQLLEKTRHYLAQPSSLKQAGDNGLELLESNKGALLCIAGIARGLV